MSSPVSLPLADCEAHHVSTTRRPEAETMHNHYWDLNECRWVLYVHGDVDEGAADVAHVPAQRTDASVPDAVPARAVATA